MRLINTTARRLAVLGHPYRMVKGAMVADPEWEKANLVYVRLPRALPLSWDHAATATKVRIHRLLAEQLAGVFEDLVQQGLWRWFTSYGGSYIVRPIIGTKNTPSAHCWGSALDFNSDTMPLRSSNTWPPAVVKVFNAHGFINGADFPRKDPMHFEATKLYP